MSYESDQIEQLFDPVEKGERLDPIPRIEAPNLRGLVRGDVTSNSRGRGTESYGTHEFESGDSYRDIDWKLTSGNPNLKPVVRDRIDEIAPSLVVVTDVFKERSTVSQGMCSERLLGASVVDSLLRVANEQHVPSALVATSDHTLYVQPKPNVRRFQKTRDDIAQLFTPEFDGEHAIEAVEMSAGRIERPELSDNEELTLTDVLRRAGKIAVGNIVFIVSDFRGDEFKDGYLNPKYESAMEQLSSNNNVLIAVELVQPGDFKLLEHTETFSTGRRTVKIGSAKKDKRGQEQRAEYERLARIKQDSIDLAIGNTCVAHMQLSTETITWLSSLRDQLKVASRIMTRNASRRR